MNTAYATSKPKIAILDQSNQFFSSKDQLAINSQNRTAKASTSHFKFRRFRNQNAEVEIRESKDKKAAQNEMKKKETRFEKTVSVEAKPVPLMKRGATLKNVEDSLKSPVPSKNTNQQDTAASL